MFVEFQSMYEAIVPFKAILGKDKPCIDNFVFRLHYRATYLMLMAFSLILTAFQLIGDPISCMVDEIPEKIMNVYCWIYSSFTITNQLEDKIGKDVAHPGVAPQNEEVDQVKYHLYYQWVGLVLVIQALLFYLPHYVWKNLEEGRLKALSANLRTPFVEDKVISEHKSIFVDYFMAYQKYHWIYFWRFFICELMNFVNVVSQIFIINTFVGGGFLTYGHDVLLYLKSDKIADPMASIFPKATKCSFHKYGPSGGIQRFDGLCILPLNILNEKIFFIIWFWFIILSIMSGLIVVYRLLTVLFPWIRSNYAMFGISDTYKDDLDDVRIRSTYGDWFILLQLKKNIDDLIFKEFIIDLAKELKNPKKIL